MIKPEQIPVEVLKAALDCWVHQSNYEAGTYTKDMRLTIAAALNAWPDVGFEFRSDNPRFYNGDLIILPLPQEGCDA